MVTYCGQLVTYVKPNDSNGTQIKNPVLALQIKEKQQRSSTYLYAPYNGWQKS